MFLDEKKAGEAQTKADPFVLESLIAWLAKQPADKAYSFAACHGECLFGQYLMAHGMPWGKGHYSTISERLPVIAIAAQRPETFGAALERARHFQARS